MHFILVGFAIPSVAFSIDFKSKGVVLKSAATSAFIVSQSAKSIEIWEPHIDKNVTYVGVPFNEMMDTMESKSWRATEEVLFTCSDGYQPSIPTAKFLKHNAWLVWARKDGASFELINRYNGNESVKLGPFYLVWDNKGSSELKDDGADDFPYQVVSIDLISFKDKFPKLAPPEKASASAKGGFVLYRKYCMKCHSIDGEGGTKGPDFAKRVLVEPIQMEDLKKWILNPQKIKPSTIMPAFGPKLKNRSKSADQIVDYLKAMHRG